MVTQPDVLDWSLPFGAHRLSGRSTELLRVRVELGFTRWLRRERPFPQGDSASRVFYQSPQDQGCRLKGLQPHSMPGPVLL